MNQKKVYKVFTQKQMSKMFKGSRKLADKWLKDNPGQDYSEEHEYDYGFTPSTISTNQFNDF